MNIISMDVLRLFTVGKARLSSGRLQLINSLFNIKIDIVFKLIIQ